MKKIIALLLVLSLAFCFVACNKDEPETPAPQGPTAPVEAEYKLAIGVALTQDAGEVANTVAAIVIDSNNKIVACRIDTLSITATLTDGLVDENTYKTKAELGAAYGMLTNSPYFGSSLAEWNDQAKAFETFVTGKTQAEVVGIAVDAEGKTTDAALKAGCTIAISDFIKAVDNAFKSAHKVSFKSAATLTLGVSAIGTVANNEDNQGDAILNSLSYTADYAATVFANGKVVAAVIDSNEATTTVEGTEFAAVTYAGTKLEQGDNYGMLTNSPYYGSSFAEWYVQAQNYANLTVGKTAAEISGLSTDKAELTGVCTMYAGGYKTALEKAASYTR